MLSRVPPSPSPADLSPLPDAPVPSSSPLPGRYTTSASRTDLPMARDHTPIEHDRMRRRFLIGLATSAAAPWLVACSSESAREQAGDGTGSTRGRPTATGGPSTRGMLAERPYPPTREPTLRVRIDRVRPDLTLPPGSFALVTAPGGTMLVRSVDRAHRGVPVQSPLRLRISATGWSILDANGFRPPIGPNDPIEITTPPGDVAELSWKDRAYPGHLRFWPRSDIAPGAVDVVSHVPIEQYLPGVLAGELYRHWHLETFVAQAVAARSFACFEFMDVAAGSSRGERRHYDLTNTTAAQVYIGGGAYPRALEAVEATRGVVLTFRERLVPGFYSSCCGGLPARALDAVSSNPVVDIDPLNGAGACDTCRDANVYRWTRTPSIALVVNRLRAWGAAQGATELAALSGLRGITVSAVNPHGRPTMYAITGRAGTIDLGAERTRRALSQQIDDDDVNGVGGSGAGGGAGGSAGGGGDRQPLRSSFFEASVRNGAVRIAGRGFGHGVGMCQHGAEGRATRGDDASSILSWYYPGSAITRAYT